MSLTAMNDPKEVKEHIARLVNYYQQERSDPKMTDKELAQRAGVVLTTVLRIKDPSFEYLPRLSTVIKIANALGVPYTDLIS